MTLDVGTRCIPLRTADGHDVLVEVLGVSAIGDRCISVKTADGKSELILVAEVEDVGDRCFPVRTADGHTVLVKVAQDDSSSSSSSLGLSSSSSSSGDDGGPLCYTGYSFFCTGEIWIADIFMNYLCGDTFSEGWNLTDNPNYAFFICYGEQACVVSGDCTEWITCNDPGTPPYPCPP